MGTIRVNKDAESMELDGLVVMPHYCAICAEERREESRDGESACRHKLLLAFLLAGGTVEEWNGMIDYQHYREDLRERQVPLYGY